jgi:hypothetical protein
MGNPIAITVFPEATEDLQPFPGISTNPRKTLYAWKGAKDHSNCIRIPQSYPEMAFHFRFSIPGSQRAIRSAVIQGSSKAARSNPRKKIQYTRSSLRYCFEREVYIPGIFP